MDDEPPDSGRPTQAIHDAIGPLRARLAAHPKGALAFVRLAELEDLLWNLEADPVTVWECYARLQAVLPFPADDPAVVRLVALLPRIPT